MTPNHQIRARTAVLMAALVGSLPAAPPPPKMLMQGAGEAMSLMRMPDGSFCFYNRHKPDGGPLSLPDRDGRRHTLLPYLPARIAGSRVIVESQVLANVQVVLTPDDHIISAQVRGETLDKEAAKKVGLSRYLDVWLNRASLTAADQPRMIWRGYNGSQMEYQQFPGGRIIVPFGSMQPHARPAPPTGRHVTVVLYSDDTGQTWRESASKIVAPCYDGFNGLNEGACEPALEQLKDGRLWMLLRAQAGFLYETFSGDQGLTWQRATASRFNTSTGPANILRHQNGWLVAAWNNCELPLRHEGEGVYGGRDALHLAVSADEGRTWRGFREIYLDFRRNGNPEKTGDRGTAYPLGAYTADGRIVMLAGQGQGGRNPILIDPDWIVATRARTDFSDGLEQWSVYRHHGPAKGWWRGRVVGGELVPNPSEPAAQCLHLRKADEHPADAGVWNFPNGWKGALKARVMIRRGSAGGIVCLNDRFFDPSAQLGQDFAVFRTPLGADGKFGNIALAPDQWYDLTLKWNLSEQQCLLLVDGKPAGKLDVGNETLNGISYVRFVSTARELDRAGFLVGEVSVEIEDPYAPACSPEDLRRHEQRYVDRVVPRWSGKL